jgi:hypothetical protein
MPSPSLEYIQRNIEWVGCKYKNRNYFSSGRERTLSGLQHLTNERIWKASHRIISENRRKNMTSSLESSSSEQPRQAEIQPFRWLGVGVVAAASVLVGGLAAAWWYRKTLSKLHEAGRNSENPDFRISGDDSSDEI